MDRKKYYITPQQRPVAKLVRMNQKWIGKERKQHREKVIFIQTSKVALANARATYLIFDIASSPLQNTSIVHI
jgi:hypothetical protein